MPGPWLSFYRHDSTGRPTERCPGTLHWRYHEDGRIEIDGQGKPESAWPADVNRWRPLIDGAAHKYDLPAAWIAATMAQETGGRNVCLNAANPSSACSPPCTCVQNEGAGVMAMQPSTASHLAGRRVTSQELLDTPALAIDLGAKYIRRNVDLFGSTPEMAPEFVNAAMAYNAGSVKCGRGSVFVPSGYDWPKEPCPDTGWGVVMGCVYTSKTYGSRCVPSTTGVKPYVCSTNYPQHAIEAQNAARTHYDGIPAVEPPVHVAAFGRGEIVTIAAGALLGYAALALYQRL